MRRHGSGKVGEARGLLSAMEGASLAMDGVGELEEVPSPWPSCHCGQLTVSRHAQPVSILIKP